MNTLPLFVPARQTLSPDMRQLPQGCRPERDRVRRLLEEGRRRFRAHHQGAVLQGVPSLTTQSEVHSSATGKYGFLIKSSQNQTEIAYVLFL